MDLYFEVINMTEDVKKKFVNTTGIISLCIAERKSTDQMASELKLDTMIVDRNIDDMLYTFRKNLGWRRYLKALFIK